MRNINNPINESERNIDWNNVEYKIGLILYRFSNISQEHKEDLAQELRIHAYYFSDDYYDLYRVAVDFWRKLTRKEYPETPYVDMELLGPSFDDTTDVLNEMSYNDLVHKVHIELQSTEGKTAKQEELDALASVIFNIITNDIKYGEDINHSVNSKKYRGGKINILYLDQVMPEYSYKKLQRALNRLREVVTMLTGFDII